MPASAVSKSFWSKNEVKAHIRNRITDKRDRQPVKNAIALPADTALDIFSARASGLMDDNTNGYFAERYESVARRLWAVMFSRIPSMTFYLFKKSITKHRHEYAELLHALPGWRKFDYCYLDYCGAMTPAMFQLHQLMAPGLKDDAVLSSTLTYSWGTGARSYKRMAAELVTQDDIDRVTQEIFELPAADRGLYTNRGVFAYRALESYVLWRKSWGVSPVLEQFYAYVGGDNADNDRRGAAMISFRTRFKAAQ